MSRQTVDKVHELGCEIYIPGVKRVSLSSISPYSDLCI